MSVITKKLSLSDQSHWDFEVVGSEGGHKVDQASNNNKLEANDILVKMEQHVSVEDLADFSGNQVETFLSIAASTKIATLLVSYNRKDENGFEPRRERVFLKDDGTWGFRLSSVEDGGKFSHTVYTVENENSTPLKTDDKVHAFDAMIDLTKMTTENVNELVTASKNFQNSQKALKVLVQVFRNKSKSSSDPATQPESTDLAAVLGLGATALTNYWLIVSRLIRYNHDCHNNDPNDTSGDNEVDERVFNAASAFAVLAGIALILLIVAYLGRSWPDHGCSNLCSNRCCNLCSNSKSGGGVEDLQRRSKRWDWGRRGAVMLFTMFMIILELLDNSLDDCTGSLSDKSGNSTG